jgi:TatD DNase family protein
MELVDTHCHLDFSDFDRDRSDILVRCQAAGINKIVVPGVTQAGWKSLLQLCESTPGVFPAFGLHPMFLQQHSPEHLGLLEEQINLYRPLAIGEIGLDFMLKDSDKEDQIKYFTAQLDIAKNADLPVLLHVRKAHDEVLMRLKKSAVRSGIAHAFNGSLQQARKYIDLGFKLGFGGTLTYAGSKKIRALAKELPIESIVLETDAPDMVVESHRGERNSPEYLTLILASLAEVRGRAVDDLARQTTANATAIFKFNDAVL